MSEQDPNQPDGQPTNPARPKLIIPGQENPQAQPQPGQPQPGQPQPAPQPTPQPAATPQPAQVEQPQPTPQPAPAPQPEATPQPAAQPQPTPAPQPAQVEQPQPTPAPQPAAQPEPTPAPQAPQPQPQPQATPAPAAPPAQPAPAPQPQPAAPPHPQQAPQPTPTPAPQAPAPQTPAPPAATPSPQVTVPLAGTQVPPQTPASAAPAAPSVNPLQTGPAATPVQAPIATPPGGRPPGPGNPGQPPLGAGGMSSLGPPKKKGMSNAVKVMIAVTLVAAIIITGIILKGKAARNERIERLNEIAANFEDPDNIPEEIALSGSDVDLLLGALYSTTAQNENEREFYLQALNIGKASDGNDISEKIATFAKDKNMNPPLRTKLFRVVGRRGEESALPSLIAFASETDDTTSGQAALEAAKSMATASNFQSLLAIITNSPNGSIKSSAVNILSKVIATSEDPSQYASPVISAYRAAAADDSKAALLRLMGSTGADEAADIVADNLESDNTTMQIAAIYALRYWPDDSQFETLLDFGQSSEDRRLRREAFSNLVEFLTESEEVNEDDLFFYWSEVAVIAAGETEQRQIVSAMGRQNEPWADDVLDYFVQKGDTDRVQALAEDTKPRLAENISRAERNERLKKQRRDADR